MKIVFLSDDFPPNSFGGAGISTFELAEGLHRAGHEVQVVTTSRKKEEAGTRDLNGLTVHTIYSSYPGEWRWYVSLYNPPTVRAVKKLFKEIQPDVVHAHNIHQYLSYACLPLARRYAKTVVWTARDVMAFNFAKLTTKRYLEQGDYRTTWRDHVKQAGKRWNPFRNILIRYFLRRVQKVAISNALKDALAANGIAPVSVIHNGIDADAWQTTREEGDRFRAAQGIGAKPVLLFSGRLSAAKGGEQAVRALALLREKTDAVLVVAGVKDAYAKEMQKIAQELGVGERLIFTGWISGAELKAAYAASTVVLFPSVCFDAFGRVNLEAMASKKPVAGTCFGGTPEVVEDGVTGYVMDPFDTELLASRILELLRDPEKARQFGEAGYARARTHFNLRDIVQKYLHLYKN